MNNSLLHPNGACPVPEDRPSGSSHPCFCDPFPTYPPSITSTLPSLPSAPSPHLQVQLAPTSRGSLHPLRTRTLSSLSPCPAVRADCFGFELCTESHLPQLHCGTRAALQGRGDGACRRLVLVLPWCHRGNPRPLQSFSLSLDTDGSVSACGLVEVQEVKKAHRPGIGPAPSLPAISQSGGERPHPAHRDASSSPGGCSNAQGCWRPPGLPGLLAQCTEVLPPRLRWSPCRFADAPQTQGFRNLLTLENRTRKKYLKEINTLVGENV